MDENSNSKSTQGSISAEGSTLAEDSTLAEGSKLTKDSTLVDARNLLCPMPVIRVQEAVESLASGSLIKAICTDPGVLHDIPAWVRVHGHTLVSAEEKNDEYIVVVKINK